MIFCEFKVDIAEVEYGETKSINEYKKIGEVNDRPVNGEELIITGVPMKINKVVWNVDRQLYEVRLDTIIVYAGDVNKITNIVHSMLYWGKLVDGKWEEPLREKYSYDESE